MPALMAKRSSSERCAIRRELHRRRKLAAAPNGGIAKKSSTAASIHKKPSADEPAGPATKNPPSVTMPTPRPRAGIVTSPASILQHAPAAVATKNKKQLAVVAKGDGATAKEIASVPLGQIAKRCTAPPRRSALNPAASSMKVSAVKRVPGVPNKSASPCRSSTAGAACIKNMPTIPARPPSSSISVKKGMTVKVRTRAGMLPTGHCLVLWLAARVVSDAAADDGFLDVMYNGNFPRDDPSRTVRVAMHDVRSMPAVGEKNGAVGEDGSGVPVFEEYSLNELCAATGGFATDSIVSEHGEKAPNIVYRGTLFVPDLDSISRVVVTGMLIALVGFGLCELRFPSVVKCIEIGLPEIILLVALSQYIPHLVPLLGTAFEGFAVIMSVAVVWLYTFILAVGGAYKNAAPKTQLHLRTDRSGLVGGAPWITIPYPFQWGAPTFDAGECFAMIAVQLLLLLLWSLLVLSLRFCNALLLL